MIDNKLLLESCAIAMGFKKFSIYDEKLGVFIETGIRRGDGGYNWNPLKSATDAMQLMAKFRINIDPTMLNRVYAAQSFYGVNIVHYYDDDDIAAAIRYAIVKAVHNIIEMTKAEQP